jgi:hypothetical protein
MPQALINKPNWDETRQRYIDFWNHTGLVIANWGGLRPSLPPSLDAPDPGSAASVEQSYTDPVWRAKQQRNLISQQHFIGDLIPIAAPHLGPGSLAIFLGSRPEYKPDTVWYHPCIFDPASHPPLCLDPDNLGWLNQLAIVREMTDLSRGQYYVGCPDLIEGLDILASLRGASQLLLDMLMEPQWVHEKLAEINKAWFQAFDAIQDIICFSDGSSAFAAFYIWSPGRAVKVQCDFSAMISPDQFAKFVVPYIREQCQGTDHSLFHLDGPDCIRHLDLLLKIPELDAISWIPGAGQPHAGDPKWYNLYRRIFDAGKSAQACSVPCAAVPDLLKAAGAKGMYIMANVAEEPEYLDLLAATDKFR